MNEYTQDTIDNTAKDNISFFPGTAQEPENAEVPTADDPDFSEASDQRVYMGTETQSVEFTLTEAELAQYARDIDEKLANITDKEVRIAGKKEAIKWLTEDIKSLSREIQGVSITRRRGTEHRNTECDIYFDYARGVKEVFCPATGELVSTRELTKNEKQMHMFAGKKPEQGEIPEAAQ